MPCLEGDRSDCQPETNSAARSQWLSPNVEVVYAMGPRLAFSKCVLLKVKIMTDGRSADVNSGNSS